MDRDERAGELLGPRPRVDWRGKGSTLEHRHHDERLSDEHPGRVAEKWPRRERHRRRDRFERREFLTNLRGHVSFPGSEDPQHHLALACWSGRSPQTKRVGGRVHSAHEGARTDKLRLGIQRGAKALELGRTQGATTLGGAELFTHGSGLYDLRALGSRLTSQTSCATMRLHMQQAIFNALADPTRRQLV